VGLKGNAKKIVSSTFLTNQKKVKQWKHKAQNLEEYHEGWHLDNDVEIEITIV